MLFNYTMCWPINRQKFALNIAQRDHGRRFHIPHQKGEVLPHGPAARLAFSISKQRRFFSG